LSDDKLNHYSEGQLLDGGFKTARNAFEAHFLAAKLQEYGGNISRLAEAIGLERSYLSRKLKQYNIQGS
jgi:two-component system nitrogen regulation response regulator NtrX